MVATSLSSCQHARSQTEIEDRCSGNPGLNLVKRSDDAIRIAWAMLVASNPKWQPMDELEWAKGFTASLDGEIWEVAAKPRPPRSYSTFVIKICANDGRFLGGEISD
jgi:hypothetical protein